MRQGDGADLLGANDPRSADIGVIYVAPTDDRQAVLAAILTQDKLGRKQIAVVLPENNRAFSRSVDFDGLKNTRRGLKAEIIFIAPPGPGPAELARQRRFTVYTSLDNYISALRAQARAASGAKGRLFGFWRKPAPAADARTVRQSRPPVKSPGAPEAAPARLPEDRTGEKTEVRDQQAPAGGDRGAAALGGGAAGLAAGLGLDALAQRDDEMSTLGRDGDNWYAVPPAAQTPGESQSTQGTMPGSPSQQEDEEVKPVPTNSRRGSSGPVPIAFPPPRPLPRITGKLPAAAAQANTSPAAPPSRRGNTGKVAALVGAGATGPAVGAAAATRGATTTGQPGGGSGAPPGGTGPGGGGPGRRTTRQLLAILLIILTLLLIAGIAFAAPGGLGRFIPGTSVTATVTITPKSKDVKDQFVILAVTGKPNPTLPQVQARVLTATSQPQSKTAQSTGSIPGRQATGALTFLNNTASPITIASTVLTGASGVPVTFNGPITVPANPPSITVTGFAVNVGARGNIPALDIVGPCCASGITVKNTTAFSGGQDPQANAVVQQSDIDGAANALVSALTPGVQAALQKQVHPNEQVVSSTLHCNKSTFSANHKAGDIARSVMVTVAITCTEEAYDQQAAFALASNSLQKDAMKDPGPGYGLVGNVVTMVAQATVIDAKGTISLLVRAEGVWAYVFTDQLKQQLKNAIAGKPRGEALAYLKAHAGVSAVQIDISSGDTLPDADHITIVIKPVAGATPPSGSPTVSPTGGTTPITTPPITPTAGLGGS